jgi:hypothetical protein
VQSDEAKERGAPSTDLTSTLARRIAEAGLLSGLYAVAWLVNRSYYEQFDVTPEAAGVSEADIALRSVLFFLFACSSVLFFGGIATQILAISVARFSRTPPEYASAEAAQAAGPAAESSEASSDAHARARLSDAAEADSGDDKPPLYLWFLLALSIGPTILSLTIPDTFAHLFWPWDYIAPTIAVTMLVAASGNPSLFTDPHWRVVFGGWLAVILVFTALYGAARVGRITADHVKSGGDPAASVAGTFSPLVGTTRCVKVMAIDPALKDLDGVEVLYLGQANATTVVSQLAGTRRTTLRLPSSSIRLAQRGFRKCR